ncbi:MAG: signal peptidase II [Hyphomicrobiaceae bacterium]
MAIFALLADQAHKLYMLEVFDIADRGRVTLTPFLDLVFVLNPGISYGLFEQSSKTGQLLLAAFSVLVAILLLVWLSRATTAMKAVAIGLLIGGALGNAIDRVRLGGVADFFLLHAFDFNWYVFNIADVAIVAGVLLLLYDSLWTSRQSAAKTT